MRLQEIKKDLEDAVSYNNSCVTDYYYDTILGGKVEELAGHTEYLLNRIERYEKALERISGSTMSQYASLNHMASEFIRVAEEALKEE